MGASAAKVLAEALHMEDPWVEKQAGGGQLGQRNT